MESLVKKAIKYVGWPHLYEETCRHQVEMLMGLGLKPEHVLLDLGAGNLGAGREFIAYLDVGNYWAIEPNSWLIDAAREEVGSLMRSRKAHIWSFEDFRLARFKQHFDFILAHSIFTHASPAQVQTILKEAHKAGDVLAATFYDQGKGNNKATKWTYPEGVVYTEEFIKGLAMKAGFGEIEFSRGIHPANHKWLVARKEWNG